MSDPARSYREYLASDRWKDIRSDAAARSQGLCELCKSVAAETHHVKYPRGHANDSVDNVLHVCSACHRRLHGMNKLVSDLQLRPLSAPTFKGRTWATDVDAEGFIWASWDSWATVLLVPMPMRSRLLTITTAHATKRQKETGEELHLSHASGDAWFKWAAIEDGLHDWYVGIRGRRDRLGNTVELDDNEKALESNYTQLRRWGQKLQQDALVGRLQQPQAGNVVALSDVQRVANAVQEMAGFLLPKVETHERVLASHDTRLNLVEQTLSARDPAEFITAASFLFERGQDPDILVGKTRMRRDQALGKRLHEERAETGPKRETRLAGVRESVTVNTYRRRDLARVFEEMRQGRR